MFVKDTPPLGSPDTSTHGAVGVDGPRPIPKVEAPEVGGGEGVEPGVLTNPGTPQGRRRRIEGPTEPGESVSLLAAAEGVGHLSVGPQGAGDVVPGQAAGVGPVARRRVRRHSRTGSRVVPPQTPRPPLLISTHNSAGVPSPREPIRLPPLLLCQGKEFGSQSRPNPDKPQRRVLRDPFNTVLTREGTMSDFLDPRRSVGVGHGSRIGRGGWG